MNTEQNVTNENIEYIPTPDEMTLDTSDFDIFSQLEDVYVEETQEEVQEPIDEDVQGFNPDDDDVSDFFDDLDDVEANAEQEANHNMVSHWEQVADNEVIYGEFTKADIQAAVQEKETYSTYNNEFNAFKSAVEQDYQAINEAVNNSMSYLDIAIATQKQKYQDAVTDTELATAARQIRLLEAEQEKVKAHAKKAMEGAENLKASVKKQEVANFVQDARRAYGAGWEQEINNIAEGVSPEVTAIVSNNLNVELINMIRDAKAYRAQTQANKNAVKSMGKKVATKSARSVSGNAKGSAPTNNKTKLENKLAQGFTSDADVFAALED